MEIASFPKGHAALDMPIGMPIKLCAILSKRFPVFRITASLPFCAGLACCSGCSPSAALWDVLSYQLGTLIHKKQPKKQGIASLSACQHKLGESLHVTQASHLWLTAASGCVCRCSGALAVPEDQPPSASPGHEWHHLCSGRCSHCRAGEATPTVA